ncbi:hypothetical protein G4228_020079 [Cervus hanglu yarkandensis]|uniref:Chromo domain-containing protein n=1 Tax=Cervus hanglu yarkandensis TaxID=84702 RepID=A0A833SGP4_9CERV|nr:hypothetical protein G4228_020079 [Cervus hanglu yarkandensis]
MASEELYEVEAIIDKRKIKKGKTENLVQWKGYDSEDNTWEPEQHLVNCECIHDFNQCHSEKQKEGTFTRTNRTSPNNGQKQIPRSTKSSFSKDALKVLVVGKEHEVKSSPLFTRLTDDYKRESARMRKAIRNFVNTFIQFMKPIIIAVNGPATGLGASILPLCDVVWANEKACFQMLYTTFRQCPDGCSTVMFPKIMGGASANEMLLCGQKPMAQGVCGKGMVSRVFWPGTFTQEVMVYSKELASCNTVVLEESKSLVCCNMKLDLEQANERECEVLKKMWRTAQGMDSMLKYLQRKIDEF